VVQCQYAHRPGCRDRLLEPKWAPTYTALLPDARLVMIPGTSHMPMLEAPGIVAPLIVDFLRE
jgi:pimeloyl-ACP methyl ester carboxylesterase